jgi:hypothetical protein
MSQSSDVPRASNTFLQRVIGAMALDTAIYEEVEADRGATAQAFTVVLLSSVAAGIGASGNVMSGFGARTVGNICLFSVAALLVWAAWALVTFQIGARVMPEAQTRADVGELLRTLGFASAPGLLRILGVMPGVALAVFGISAVWMLASTVVAVRQALDYTSTARAITVCAIGWVLSIALALLLGSVFGPTVT